MTQYITFYFSMQMYHKFIHSRFLIYYKKKINIDSSQSTLLKQFMQIFNYPFEMKRCILQIRLYLALVVTDGGRPSARSTFGMNPPWLGSWLGSIQRSFMYLVRKECWSESFLISNRAFLPLMLQRAVDATSPSAWDSTRFPEPFP